MPALRSSRGHECLRYQKGKTPEGAWVEPHSCGFRFHSVAIHGHAGAPCCLPASHLNGSFGRGDNHMAAYSALPASAPPLSDLPQTIAPTIAPATVVSTIVPRNQVRAIW